jgi:hypothetical protein
MRSSSSRKSVIVGDRGLASRVSALIRRVTVGGGSGRRTTSRRTCAAASWGISVTLHGDHEELLNLKAP